MDDLNPVPELMVVDVDSDPGPARPLTHGDRSRADLITHLLPESDSIIELVLTGYMIRTRTRSRTRGLCRRTCFMDAAKITGRSDVMAEVESLSLDNIMFPDSLLSAAPLLETLVIPVWSLAGWQGYTDNWLCPSLQTVRITTCVEAPDSLKDSQLDLLRSRAEECVLRGSNTLNVAPSIGLVYLLRNVLGFSESYKLPILQVEGFALHSSTVRQLEALVTAVAVGQM